MKNHLFSIDGPFKMIKTSLFVLVFILFVSYVCSFIIPEARYMFPDIFWYFVLGLPQILTSLSFVLILSILLKRDHLPCRTKALAKRLQVRKIIFKDFLKSFGIFLVLILSSLILNFFLKKFGVPMAQDLKFAEQVKDLKPDKLAVAFYVIGILSGAILEEFLWRGYLLPLQQKKLGRKAWILNGGLWALSHIIVYNPLKITITAFGFSYIAQRFGTIWYTIIFHLLINGAVAVMFLRNLGYFD